MSLWKRWMVSGHQTFVLSFKFLQNIPNQRCPATSRYMNKCWLQSPIRHPANKIIFAILEILSTETHLKMSQNDDKFIQSLTFMCQMKHFINKNSVHCYSRDVCICRWGLCHTPTWQVNQCVWWHHFYSWSQCPCLYRKSEWSVATKSASFFLYVVWKMAWTNDGWYQAIIWTDSDPLDIRYVFKENWHFHETHLTIMFAKWRAYRSGLNASPSHETYWRLHSIDCRICKRRTYHSTTWRVNQCVWWHFNNWTWCPRVCRNSERLAATQYSFIFIYVVWWMAWTKDDQHQAFIGMLTSDFNH